MGCTNKNCTCTTYRPSGLFRRVGIGGRRELCECGHMDTTHREGGRHDLPLTNLPGEDASYIQVKPREK